MTIALSINIQVQSGAKKRCASINLINISISQNKPEINNYNCIIVEERRGMGIIILKSDSMAFLMTIVRYVHV